MSTNNSAKKLEPPKRLSRYYRIALATIVILLATSILVNYDRNIHPLSYATTALAWIIANLSIFRVTLIVGLGGSLLSIPVMRRGRSELVKKRPDRPHYSGQPVASHPLLLTPRPSRDTKFIIRKTKKRGRISRNHAGQRFPATPQNKHEFDLD